MNPEHAEAEIQSIIRRVSERHGARVEFECEWDEDGACKMCNRFTLNARQARLCGLLMVCQFTLLGAQVALVVVYLATGISMSSQITLGSAGVLFTLPFLIFSRRLCPPASLDAITAEYSAEIARRIPGIYFR